MKVVGTVDIINSLAHSAGLGTKSKLGRACKGVLQVRNRSDGRQFLVVSTRKDVIAHEYDVKMIKKIRSLFACDGFVTIEISQPPMNVMLRNCNPEELQKFITELETIIGKQIATGNTSNVPKTTSRTSLLSSSEDPEMKDTPGSLRRSCGSLKRPRSPELSKTTTAKVQKCLRTENTLLSVKSRDKYPSQFMDTLEQVRIHTVGLKIVDKRILRLKWLTVLDLTGNKIKEINQLANLSCSLLSLVVAQNEIGSIPDDLFSYPPFRKLNQLDISNNQLSILPSSILRLTTLSKANFGRNNIMFLPYNWQDMKCLRVLDISCNDLISIPKPIVHLELTRLDMSGNKYLQCVTGETSQVFGNCDMPTLFELSCESVMNLQRKKRISSSELLPAIIESYLKHGKYCQLCGRMVLRFKATTTNVQAQHLCTAGLSACLISPAAPCNVKTVMCVDCGSKRGSRAL